jgi:hypothetical protein
MISHHVYGVRPRNDKRSVDLISDVLPCHPCDTKKRRMQLSMQNFAAVSMMLWCAFTLNVAT